MNTDTDRLDIDATLQGDDDAYRRIVERYQQQIARTMWRFCRESGTCEELVQDVFVEAYTSLAGYRGQGAFAGWLSRIATRVGYRYWKQRSQQRSQYTLEAADATVEAAQDRELDAQTAAGLLNNLLNQMKEADRLVLVLMYFEQCSIDEIAKRTGWNRSIIKMRAYRARNRLKELADKQSLWEKLGWIE